MSARIISKFRVEQLADFVWNSADVIRSRTDVLRLFVFYSDCEDDTLSNLTLILQTRSMGKSYLLIVHKSGSVPSSSHLLLSVSAC